MKKEFIIGIDLGGTNLKIGLLGEKYRILRKIVTPTVKFSKKEDLICGIINFVNGMIKEENLNKSTILGLGLGLPGPVDQKSGTVHFFPNIPGWRKVRLQRILKQRLKLPVFLDNDAKLMAIAEQRLGAAKGFSNVLCITLGTGIGGGLILGGNIYRGQKNAAGEIGHLPINEIGPVCNCQGVACLEAYIGNKKILKEARKRFMRDISLEELSILASRNNKQAKEIWLKVAERLGIALAGAVNLLNLDAIVIGGGVSGAGKLLFDKVKRTINERAMSVQARHVKVLKTKLGNDAGLIGSAIMVKAGLKHKRRYSG